MSNNNQQPTKNPYVRDIERQVGDTLNSALQAGNTAVGKPDGQPKDTQQGKPTAEKKGPKQNEKVEGIVHDINRQILSAVGMDSSKYGGKPAEQSGAKPANGPQK